MHVWSRGDFVVEPIVYGREGDAEFDGELLLGGDEPKAERRNVTE